MFRFTPICVLVILLSTGSPVSGDVTFKWSMKTVLFDLPPTESTSIDQISGDRARSTIEAFGPGMPGMPEGESTTDIFIVRLDQGIMWILDAGAGTYDELPLTAISEYDKMVSAAIESGDSDPFEWTLDFQDTGDTVINGRTCTGRTGTAVGVNRDDASERVSVTYAQWLTDTIPGDDEFTEFSRLYREIAGSKFDQQQTVIRSTLSQYCPVYDSLFNGVCDRPGFPVRMDVAVRAEGYWDDEDNGDGEAVSALLEAIAMAQYLGAQMDRESTGGPVTLFSFSSELTDIDTTAVDPALFDIPEGYTSQQ